MCGINIEIREKLFSMSDEEYKIFQAKLMPTVEPEKIIGVRTPLLRKYSAELVNRSDINGFLSALPHDFYDENNLHGFIIERIRDYSTAVAAVDAFLPFVDNWATCDSLSPKVFAKHRLELKDKIREWLASEKTYTIRFGIEMLMTYFLDDDFSAEYLKLVASLRSEEYYVNMMIAWFFATALAKQYDASLPFIADRRLDIWVHNKTIRKAIESRRITDEQKDFLRSLAIKRG